MNPAGLSPAQLFSMVEGKRKENRQSLYMQASIIWRLGFGDAMSKQEFSDFVQYGATGGKSKSIPNSPELDAKVKEIQDNGGRLIVEVPNG